MGKVYFCNYMYGCCINIFSRGKCNKMVRLC